MSKDLFIGLMSGTSLDGVDAVLAELGSSTCNITHAHFSPFDAQLKQTILGLHDCGDNELERAAQLSNQLSRQYANAIETVLRKAKLSSSAVTAIGCHGQTVRHRPELGFTIQLVNAALLAELSGITVVSDFRSRDLAAGGQGAPLVPAFHQAMFQHHALNRVVLNIGGIANLTYLPVDQNVIGFDSGPGNMLMDAWIKHCHDLDFDENGQWAASGNIITPLLQQMLAEPYFAIRAPKSTGRDLFNLHWLLPQLSASYRIEDIQRTLLELTATSIANAIKLSCAKVDEIYLCGGGACNQFLVSRLRELLQPVKIEPTEDLGIAANHVEGAAFAWLACQALRQKPGNLPAVTGANGPRILGAIYAC